MESVPGTRTRRRFVATVALGWAVAGSGSAAAQGLETHHPEVPSAGIASENGPGALWVNPANLSYDPDPRFGVFATRQATSLSSLAATVGVDGMGLGIHNRLQNYGGGVTSDWSLDYGTSIALPQRISVGLLLSWNLIGEPVGNDVEGLGKNYVGTDVGLAWRPLPWLGFGGVAQNIGSPDPAGLAQPRTGAGVALRPLGPFVVLSGEYARVFGTAPDTDDVDHAVATARLRPVEGLYLRGSVDLPFDQDGLAGPVIGAGIELYFDGFGVGGVANLDQDGALGSETAFVGTDDPGESLFESGRRVPELDLDAPPAYQPRGGLFGGDATSWLDTLELLRRVEDDPGVRGLVVTLDGTGLGFARGKELRDRFLELESRGKPVLVYLTGSPGNTDYYVASAATKVAMHPATDLDLTGLSIELTQYRGLLDLVGVEPQYVKRSDYKSSPEQYTELEPTAANLEMTESLLDGLYGELVDGIAVGRKVEASVVRGWIDNGPHSAQEALDAGLVDSLLYPDQLDDALEALHDGKVATPDLLASPQPHSAWEDPQQIAVVYVEGGITSGPSSRGGGLFSSGRTSGSASVVRALDRAGNDPLVQAVVLRVDSPGGSSFASDEIWHATQRIEEHGKPVVVSMGSYAASGGYYVSAGADAIWAEPSTLTGSIGVYSGKFSIGELQERLGVQTTLLGRGANSSVRSMSVPWDDVQRAKMESLVDQTYVQFKDRVAEGRDLTPEQVEEIARGRVWTGAQAKERGLVDGIGGFQEAIADARERAGIPANRKVGLITYSDSGDLLQSLAPSFATGIAGPLPRMVARALAPPEPALAPVLDLLAPADPLWLPALHPEETVWALAPYGIRIREK